MAKSKILWKFIEMPDMEQCPQFIPRMLLLAAKHLGDGDGWVSKDEVEAYLGEKDETGYNRLRSITPLKQTMTRHQGTLAKNGWLQVALSYD